MSHQPKPDPPERTWFPLWEMLTDRGRALVREAFDLPDGWAPPVLKPLHHAAQIEHLRELERLMRLRPRLLDQEKRRLGDDDA